MKLHKDCKPELAASKDKTRHVIAETYLDIADGKGTLVSTDGRILAAVPVALDAADVAGYVSHACLKAARKTAPRGDEAHVTLNGIATFHDGSTLPRTVDNADSKFPNWRQVVPAPYETPAIVIRLDALRLWQLAQAMGTQAVCITVQAPDKPFQVTPQHGGKYNTDCAAPVCMEARGVIMPIADNRG